ncbi:putative short chain dehydrogenase/reductase [Thalassospira tepidiphila]|uniref:SDR family oxidoreductase n=1 Tax=Thalassospira tepidiphila TaxID=393657 RepID=UPI0029201652|nr:putative short chain dehydrogenase/reductase [Thalassospira tepidiphila]
MDHVAITHVWVRILNKTCFVIGADSSVGRGLVEVYAKAGYQVIGTSRREPALPDKNIFSIDLENPGSLRTLAKKAGAIDVLILCIGMLPGKDLRHYTDTELSEVFHANAIIAMKVVRDLLDYMRVGGVVLFMGSIAGSAGSYDDAYAASKAALVGLTKSLAKKSSNGVRFNCVAPGLIEGSTMFGGFTEDEIKRHEQQTPVGKLLMLDDLVRICFDITQPHWSSLNGQVIDINGGRYV